MKATKKLLSLLLAVVLVCTTLPLALAEDGDATIYGTDGNLVWTLDNKGVLTINGEGEMPDFYWNGSTYIYTYGDWSSYRGAITKVIIKDGVTSIGSSAFSDCTSLTSVTIPDSVTSIGNGAFSNCRALTSVTIPDGVTSIGYEAFYNCDALTNVTIPGSVTSIGSSAFYSCDSLTSVTIGSGVTSIGSWAFYNCDALTSITIPDNVTSIDDHAFYDCDGLANITIPDSVTSIGSSAFRNCDALTSVTIGNGVTSIGDQAFYNCDALTSVTIPDSVTSIGSNAFFDCNALTSVTIGNGVTSIGSDAFWYSPISRVDIGDLAAWCKIGFGNSYANPLGYHGGDIYLNGELLETVDVPEGVSTINAYAFYNCRSIKAVTLPITVGSIGPDAFYGRKQTEQQWVNGQYEDVDVYYGCKNLESVTILNGLCTIADSATAISPTATIISYDDTEAQAYAEKYDRTFVSLGEYTHEHTPVVHEEPGTCRTKGFRLTTCSVCGEQISFEDLGYREHDYYVSDHVGVCTEEHTVYYHCRVCGEPYSETLPAGEHDYESHMKGICTEDHEVVFTCKICGDSYTEDEAATEHVYEGPYRVESCGGVVDFYYCPRCYYELEDVIEAPNHAYELTNQKEAVCGNDGYKEYRCQNCGRFKIETIPAPGEHQFGDWIIDYSANCLNEGRKHRRCAICGYDEFETIPKTGHAFNVSSVTGSCVEGCTITYYCGWCGARKTETTEPGEHRFVLNGIKKISDTEHRFYYSCEVCSDSKTEDQLHSYGDWIVEKYVSCDESGHEYRVCSVCGGKEEKTIPATGHTFTPWSRFVMAEDAAYEVEIRFCNTCGYYELRQAGQSGPSDPTNPTNPTDPTEPTNPTDPTEPTNPTDPTEPTNPTDPTDPTNPTDPTEPTTEPTTQPSGENEQNEEPQGFFQRIAAFFRNLFDRIFGIFRR